MKRNAAFLAIGLFTSAISPSVVRAQQPDGPIGQVQQGLVGGLLVEAQTQEEFGLLTLTNPAGTCSASMLNDYWAITAAHCVFPSQTATSVQFAPNQITLTANWVGKPRTSTALQVIAFSAFPFPNDVALLQTGLHAFTGPVPRVRKLREQSSMLNLPVLAFGRGINQLAFQAGMIAVPSQSDGLFRSAQFDIAGVTGWPPQTFSYAGKNGAIVAGGDSGGPSYFQDFDDPLSTKRKLEWQLIGVHSRCVTTCLAGQSCSPPANPWQFVSSIQSCTDATVVQNIPVIVNTIQQTPVDDSPTGVFSTTVPAEVLKHRRALYALSLDEPLVAPPNAAIDIQLTFKQCHSILYLGAGCPLEPALQIWSYDPATHRVLHVLSGMCLNISGARQDPGSPIIFYPCSGTPNEKWTVIAPPGRSTWTIKSDLTGQCLNAVPGTTGGSSGGILTLPRAATLTQMPCNGSPAQIFDDADADWATRMGPH
jgi:hypothetical protein